MTCVIRPATSAECPTILHFISQLADYEKLSHELVASTDDLRRTLFPAHGSPSAHCIFACVDEKPVGFALYFYNFSTFLARRGVYLEDLFVSPEHRGNGYGKALLLHLARQAHQDGCGRMEWSVLDWNQPSIDFYRSLGAELLTEWTTCRLDQSALAKLAE